VRISLDLLWASAFSRFLSTSETPKVASFSGFTRFPAQSVTSALVVGVALLALLPIFAFSGQREALSSSGRASTTSDDDGGGVQILSPTEGSVFESGDSVFVTIESVAPFEAHSVLLLSEFDVSEDSEPPFEFILDIPVDFVGRSTISGLGKNASGGLADAGSVEIVVESSAKLTGISLSPRDVYLNGLNDRRQLRVIGQFADGQERAMSDLNDAVSFVISDPSVLSVSESGVLIPKNGGSATVSVRSGDFADSMTVEVLNVDQ
jgi:hypothetical protein